MAVNLELRRISTDPEPARHDVEPDGTQITFGIHVKTKEIAR